MSPVTYLVPLLLVGGATAAAMLAVVLWRRTVSIGGPEIVGFVGLAAGATVWSWSYALQLRADSLATILAYNNLLWIGTGVVGAAWPVFAFAVAGDERWLTRRRLPVVSGVPLLFAGMAISNPAHRLVYADVSLVVVGGVTRASVTPGIGFAVFLVWSYGLNLYVLWRLVRSVRDSTGKTRARRVAVFGAGLLPTVAGAVSIFVIPTDGPPIDFTPAMFAVTTVLTGVAITRYRLLDSVAVAQDHIANHLADPVVIVDGDATIRATNEAATRLFADDRVVGRSVGDVFGAHPELVEAVRARPPSGESPATVTIDWETRRPRPEDRSSDAAPPDTPDPGDGTVAVDRRTFAVSVGSLDRTDATVLVLRDITDRRAAERRVTVLNRVLRHDLRNDISVIDGYLDLLERELADAESETVTDALEVLIARTEGMLAVTEQAALAERIVDGDPEVRRVDLATIVRARCEQVRVEHPEVRLETTIAEEPVSVSAVAVFPSVVDNLIENAIEHSGRERPWLGVSVAVDPDRSVAEVRVADDGPGIPAADRDVLVGIEPSLENASGLGLWLINRITRLSGGDVEVTDREPEGTVVSLTVPLAEATEPPAAVRST